MRVPQITRTTRYGAMAVDSPMASSGIQAGTQVMAGMLLWVGDTLVTICWWLGYTLVSPSLVFTSDPTSSLLAVGGAWSTDGIVCVCQGVAETDVAEDSVVVAAVEMVDSEAEKEVVVGRYHSATGMYTNSHQEPLNFAL
eukprot:gene25408-31025_t